MFFNKGFKSSACIIKPLEKNILYILIYFLFSSFYLYPQKTYMPEFGDPLTELWRWTTFDELSGKGVRCIAESSDGNIWFGANNGIIRYNGLEWQEYNSSNGFIENTVYHLSYSNNQTLYAGTNVGLYTFNDGQWEKIFPAGNVTENNQLQNINCLKKLHDGSIIASVGKGIYNGLALFYENKIIFMASQKTIDSIGLINGVKMQIVPDEKCMDNIFYVEEVFQDNQNRIWIWASQGLEYGHVFYMIIKTNENFEIKYSKNFTSSHGLVKGDGSRFSQDKQGNIWMVNNEYDKGISIYNGSKWKYFKLRGENSHLSVSNINGDIWIGGFAVLNIYKNNKWKKYQRPLIPIPDSYISVYKDNSGYLWIIGTQNEIIRIDYSNKKWASYKSLNFQCEDKSGNQWFLSVDGKVVIKKENKWFSYSNEDGLPDAPVKIYCLRNGQICVAGSFNEKASISFFNEQKWERQVYPELSWGIDYRAVYEDTEGNLWIGASVNSDHNKGQKSGVIKLKYPGTKKQEKVHYTPHDGIEKENAYGIAQTKDGIIWLAGTHLNYFEKGKWRRYTEIDELTKYSNCLGNTPTGELWVGSRMYGVFLYDKNWQNFNIKSGLKSNAIISILPVNNHDVYIATTRDFSRYDGKSWTTDILPENFTLSREGGDIQIQPNGTLWINRSSREWKRRALNNNIIEKEDEEYFSTFSYKTDTLKPNTKILFYSNEVPSTGNTFIEWTGSDQWQSSRNLNLQYSYRLNEGEWSEFSYNKNITFLNLKDGKYKFEVKARDMDFNIDSSPDMVNFIVLPPVWKQAWFIILISIFLIVIIVYQYSAIKRNKSLARLNLQLEKHSNDIEKKNFLLEEHSNEIERKNILLEEQKEQILQQNILEKERNLGKIRFFTNISHEFRIPLTLVTGMIDTLSEKTFKKNPSFFKNQLSTIKRNANQLLRLIDQLMDFRKLENDSMVLKISKSNLVRFIEDICNSFAVFAQKHRIKLKFSTKIKKLEAWFDQNKVERILYNLISNAIKFTSEGGCISIKLNSIKINTTTFAEIIIEDTGIGIADDEIKKIFEPFYQVKNVNKSKYEGTGIGLSIVYNLIKLHHGNMEVISTTDKNYHLKRGFSTRFTINVPIEKSVYKDNEIIQATEISDPIKDSVYYYDDYELDNTNSLQGDIKLTNKRAQPLIIIVEDNNDLRRFIVNELSNYYKVIDASNGSDGFKLSVANMPDLILSDIMMPEMSGVELCDKLKTDIRTSHIPVILLTARTTDENKIEGFQIGADDYITKPFNISLLIARINNLLAIRLNLRQKFNKEEFTQLDDKYVTSIDKQFMQKVKTIVENNFSDHLFGVQELSNEIGISRRHLLFKLQNLIDMTPNEYIKNFRLKIAAHYLKSKKASISEIVYEVGFNDISYFSKCFTKYFGMNPSKYIQTYYKKNENL